MKAIQYIYMTQKKYLVHDNVEKVGRECHCKDCGMSWKESVSSPILWDKEEDIGKYYPKSKLVLCNAK